MAEPAGRSVALGLGSNLGDRVARLREAVEALGAFVDIEAVSSIYESAPVGWEAQPDFLNAVVVGRSGLDAVMLLARAHEVERAAGRVRTFRNAPRPLDVDLIFYGDLVRTGEAPLLPHPRWARRAFVLAPLAEVAPNMVDPQSGRTVEAVWNDARGRLPPVHVVQGSDALWRKGA